MKVSTIDIKGEVHGYKKYLIPTNLKCSTVGMYFRALEKFLIFCKEHYGEDDLYQTHAQEYLLGRVALGRCWSTINVDYSALR